jgi:hypothetical protein
MTPVPVLAKGKTDTGRCWVYVRDDRPFGGTAPSAAMFYYSRDRTAEHPQAHLANYAGIFQADAYSGYNKLYEPDRMPGPILEGACWIHARRREPPDRDTISRYVIKIARLGGHLARANDPAPGNIVMWRGFSRLSDIELGAISGAQFVGN